MATIKKILCPLDFSEPSDEALQYAAELAKRLDAELVLLHVFRDPIYAVPLGPEIGTQTAGIIEGLRKQQQERLDEVEKKQREAGVRVSSELREGVPYSQILDASKELSADLIVMGTHGHTGLSRLLLGSVAERVVRLSECPVLTLRPPTDE